MKNFRSGRAAAPFTAAALTLIITVALCVYSQDFTARLCGIAMALSYPGSGRETILSGSVPEALSPVQTQPEKETVRQTAEAPTEQTVTDIQTEQTVSPVISAYTQPEDIQAMSEQFILEHESETPSGQILEEFFGSAGAVTVGNAAVRNSTAEQSPDFEMLLEKGADIQIGEKGEILVLIIHTHTSEAYQLADLGKFYSSFSSRGSLQDRNIVRVGDMLTRVLRSYGIGVIHDTNVYDGAYNGAYSRSRAAIAGYIEENPSIQIVLDVHRDAIYYSDTVRCKPTAEIDGRKAAQIMIITGAQEGIVTNFPEWESNLAFALELQDKTSSLYEGLMKPVYFCQRQYNMDMTKCSLLVEVGTDSNTIGEAVYSAFLLGHSLGQLVGEYYGE